MDRGAMTLQNVEDVLVVSDVGLQASTVSSSCLHVLPNTITFDHDYSMHSRLCQAEFTVCSEAIASVSTVPNVQSPTP